MTRCQGRSPKVRARSFAALVTLAVSAADATALAQSRDSCIAAFEEGQTLREQLKLRAARERFIQCARDACAAPLRKDCAEAMEGATRDLPTVVLGARDEEGHDLDGVRVLVDGEALVTDQSGRSAPLDPGPHSLRFEHPSYPALTEHIVVRMGERNRAVIVTLRRASPPAEAGPPPLAYGLAGAGVVGLGGFTFFAVTGKDAKDRLVTQCAPACTDAQVSDVRTRYIAADVSLAVGVVAAGLATYFFARSIWK